MKFSPFARLRQTTNAETNDESIGVDAIEPQADREETEEAEYVPQPPKDNLVASGFDDGESVTDEYGRIEAFDGKYLSGWYFNTSRHSRGLKVVFDGQVLCGTVANLSRRDVSDAYPIAPEHCGFFVDLERYGILNKCEDLTDLYRRLSVRTMSEKQLAHFYADPFVSLRYADEDVEDIASSFDTVDDGIVRGWSVKPKRGTASPIHVFVDDLLQGTARTGYYRQDIGELHDDFNAGFCFFLSPRFLDGQRHSISCIFADSGTHLEGSPKDIVLSSRISDESKRANMLVEGFLKLEQEISDLREQIAHSATTGAAHVANYPLYQDVVQPGKTSIARLMKIEADAAPALFSIVMPTFKSDIILLGKAIDSVVGQTDRNWELIISDSASDAAIRNYIKSREQADERIKVVFNDERLGISDNTNVALRAATGEYICFMDHDDELAPEAISLNRIAFATGLYDLVYSDEDKIDAYGNFVQPHYKPAFNIDLLLCMNFLCHLVCVRRSTLFKTELNRRAYDGAQDWDLLLQVMLHIEPERVGHIPRVLYHWRMSVGSTAANISGKSYAVNAGLQAVTAHLEAAKLDAFASPLPGGLPYVDVRWRMQPNAKVSIIIPTKDRVDLVTNCVSSVLMTVGDVDLEILIVDNNSSAASSAAFENLLNDKRIRIVRFNGAFNYSAINNFAAQQATGSHLLLLNNDVFFTKKGWLEQMLGIAQRANVGAVGLKLLYPDNTIQHCGVVLGSGGVAGHAFSRLPLEEHGYFARAVCTHEVSAVTAACLLVSTEAFWKVGGLDEQDLTIAFNDVDFCMKLQAAGLRNILLATTFGYHAESVSRGFEDTLEKIARFNGESDTMRARWGKKLTSDRFYSPNFDLYHACYSVLDLVNIAKQEQRMTGETIAR